MTLLGDGRMHDDGNQKERRIYICKENHAIKKGKGWKQGDNGEVDICIKKKRDRLRSLCFACDGKKIYEIQTIS